MVGVSPDLKEMFRDYCLVIDADDGETDADTPATDWVETAAALLTDADLPPDVPGPSNKIARARDPDCVDADGQVSPNRVESVTADDRQRVIEHLGWTDTADVDQIRQEAAPELDLLTATPEAGVVRTDGGQRPTTHRKGD